MFHMIVPQLFDRHQAGTGAEFKVWLQVHWSSPVKTFRVDLQHGTGYPPP